MTRLAEIASARQRLVLGAMSGTSLDAVDMALCRIHGASAETGVELLHYAESGLDGALREQIRELAFRPEVSLEQVLRLHRRLSREWVSLISKQLDEWGTPASSVDLLASHGQTILHLPDPGEGLHATLQLVDGDLLAARLGIPVISDFRQKHIATGQEGAPLAPLAESLLFRSGREERVLLNLGGIGNLTVLPAGHTPGESVWASDTGPANTLLDEAVRHLLPGRTYDDRGKTARSGTVHNDLLDVLFEHPFFSRPLPASTGQEEFSWSWFHRTMLKTAPDLKTPDLLATLTELTARSVARAIPEGTRLRNPVVYISGGGWHNRYLRERISAALPGAKLESSETLGIDPSAKEAILFAVLANETVAGRGWRDPEGRLFTLGKISLP